MPSTPAADELLTTAQTARRLGLAPSTLEAKRRAGRGPAHVRVGSRTIRYRLSDVDAYIRELDDTGDLPALTAAG